MRPGIILKAKKDPGVHNLGLFGKKIDGSLALQDQGPILELRKVREVPVNIVNSNDVWITVRGFSRPYIPKPVLP
jgi:hypothetical protein